MTIQKFLGAFIGAIIIMSSTSAWGAGFLLKLGYDWGGEEIGTVYLSDGSDDSLHAGEGIVLSAGLSMAGSDKPLDLQATIGYKLGGAGASNGNFEWSAKQADLLAFYRVNSMLRIGGGFTYHFDPVAETNGDLSGLKETFDDALGYMAILEFNRGSWFVGLQHTWIEYDLIEYNSISVSAFDIKANGDSFGIYAGKQWD